MPELSPFRALRYQEFAGPMSDLLAPPYDVIDQQLARRLRDRNPVNAVRLVLPAGEAPARYADTASLLSDWIESGILQLDPVPSVTVYRQRFQGPDGPVSRHALFAALRLSPFGEGQVLPHERTHSGPKQDRLALTLATRAQLSPVFLIARDAELALHDSILGIGESEPDCTAETDDGVSHASWTVSDPDACAALCRAAGSGPLLIADGHHRYETALEVRRMIGGDCPAAEWVLACVVSSGDPGLRIQPTHRTLVGSPPGPDLRAWTDLLGADFILESLEPRDPAALAREAEDGESPVLVTAAGAWRLRPTAEALRSTGLDDLDLSIASVVLDRLVVQKILGIDADQAAHEGRLAYHRDPREAISAAGAEGAAFLLPAVGQDAVWEVSGLGRRLPPKSTYYEPKIPSGLVFRPLRDE